MAAYLVGACVQVRYETGSWGNKQLHKSTGIITHINWDTVNVFSGMSKHSDDVYSPVTVTVLVDGERRRLANLPSLFNTIGENGKIATYWGHGEGPCDLIKVITNSPTPYHLSGLLPTRKALELLSRREPMNNYKTV